MKKNKREAIMWAVKVLPSQVTEHVIPPFRHIVKSRSFARELAGRFAPRGKVVRVKVTVEELR